MILDLSTSKELTLGFDPVAVEERFPSVAFNVIAQLSMPFQTVRIEIKECWISHSELNRFEEELAALTARTEGHAILRNMSEIPVITVTQSQGKFITRIHAEDKVGVGNAVLDVIGYPSESREMYRKLAEYPKWW